MRRHKNQKHAVPRSNQYGGKTGCMFKVSYKANIDIAITFPKSFAVSAETTKKTVNIYFFTHTKLIQL